MTVNVCLALLRFVVRRCLELTTLSLLLHGIPKTTCLLLGELIPQRLLSPVAV